MKEPAAALDGESERPTLELGQLELQRAGVTLGKPLDLSTGARRVGLLGEWDPLVQALTGRAQIVGGRAQLLGCSLERALAEGVLGFAACDPPLPTSFTVTEYLQHAARLTHGSFTGAAQGAARALERFGLGALARLPLARLALFQQRAVGIAAATVGDPPVIWLEAPQRGLDARAADYVKQLCVEAARHGRTIVSGAVPGSPSAERTLFEGCDELFVLEHGQLVAHGAPTRVFATTRRYLLTVAGARVAEFRAALLASECRVEVRPISGAYAVELPASSSTDLLLDSALDHGLVVLELEPVFGAN